MEFEKPTFNAVMIGNEGLTILLEILYKIHNQHNHIYYISKNYSFGEYIKNAFNILNIKINTLSINEFINMNIKQNNLPAIQPGEKHNLYIFDLIEDDFNKNEIVIIKNTIFTSRRQYSTITIHNFYEKIPKIIRLSASHLFITNYLNKKDINIIFKEHNTPKNNIEKITELCYKITPFKFVFFDIWNYNSTLC